MNSHIYGILRTEVSGFSKIRKILINFTRKITLLCLWSDANNFQNFKLTLNSFSSLKYTSVLWLPELRQTLYVALYNVMFRFVEYLHWKILFFCGEIWLQGIENYGWREVRERNTNCAIKICQAVLQAISSAQIRARLFMSKNFLEIWRPICHLLCIQSSIN